VGEGGAVRGCQGGVIRFEDGARYEAAMGIWSRLAGGIFLDWLAPRPGLRWIDIGCGNGAFTQLIAARSAPAEVQGIDPSAGQLDYARRRATTCPTQFRQGDAQALPFPSDSFDAAVMALVIVFVPDPARGVDEMVRVVRPGGTVAAYVWDMLGGGFPLEPILTEMRALGLGPPSPPQVRASGMQALLELWTNAGLEAVQARDIAVSRTFADFDEYWSINLLSPTIGSVVAALPSDQAETLKNRVRARLAKDGGGPLACAARAHAIRGLRSARRSSKDRPRRAGRRRRS
jgi:ubiquinone/menaquinone biosynthesis C-methylase UbiE